MSENPERTLEITQCLLCGSDSSMHSHFESHQSESGKDQYLLCRRCGLVFQSPRLDQEALDAFYSATYRELVQGSVEPTEKDLRIQSARARNLVNFLSDRCESVTRCLDIGSSTGILLNVIKNYFDCDVIGVEPGDAYRDYSKNEGVPAVKSLEELGADYERSFDLITMGHTLEHLPQPLSYLKKLKERWLKEDGCLLIEVPNLYGHSSFELAHLTAFSSRTLRSMIVQAGFEVIKLRAHGDPRSKLIPLYITALAVGRSESSRSHDFHTIPLWVRARRRLGMLWNRLATRFLSRWAWLPWPEME